jgi:peptidoglycan biosynthesis protein MviN/MurJ (putative lipid II flippase)
LSALKVEAIDNLVGQFFSYLPRVFSALVILAVGYTVAGFISRAVLISAANSGYHYAKLLAESVRVLLIVMIVAMVMEQLQIATNIVLAAFSIVFGGIVVALAIAFGVGGISAAQRIIEKEFGKERSEKAREDIEHL